MFASEMGFAALIEPNKFPGIARSWQRQMTSGWHISLLGLENQRFSLCEFGQLHNLFGSDHIHHISSHFITFHHISSLDVNDMNHIKSIGLKLMSYKASASHHPSSLFQVPAGRRCAQNPSSPPSLRGLRQGGPHWGRGHHGWKLSEFR